MLVPSWMPQSEELTTLANRKSFEACAQNFTALKSMVETFEAQANDLDIDSAYGTLRYMAEQIAKITSAIGPAQESPAPLTPTPHTSTGSKTPDQRRNESVWYYIRRNYQVNPTELKKTQPSRYAELRAEALELWDTGHLSPSGIRK